jgi:hypothetical protein
LGEDEEATSSKGERQRPAGCVTHLAGHLFKDLPRTQLLFLPMKTEVVKVASPQ